jgi:glycosyltransferase involved in cell wall biosynthesis
MTAPLRLLTFTTLFPNQEQPNHGIFVENRLRHLVATGEVESTVLAPVPFFPSRAALFGGWGAYARVPAVETRHGLVIHHPRFPVIPRIGMNVSPFLLYQASRRALRRLVAAGLRFDAIDAHYLYPDGVAAVRLGAEFGVPVVLTARGSDVTQFPDHPVPRRLIQQAVARAAAVITVSAGLRAALLGLGAAAEKLTVLRNGVDTQLFRPADREAARAALGLTGPTLISVGALIPRKRHDLTIGALRLLPGFSLLIAGEGPERARLSALAGRLGLAGRVRLPGAQPHIRLPHYYSAADISVLASSREGWANVLLESMACGTPVVASDIPGNPEVVQARAAGLIVPANTPEGIAASVRDLWADLPARAATRAYAEQFGWEATSRGQIDLFQQVLKEWGQGASRPLAGPGQSPGLAC